MVEKEERIIHNCTRLCLLDVGVNLTARANKMGHRVLFLSCQIQANLNMTNLIIMSKY